MCKFLHNLHFLKIFPDVMCQKLTAVIVAYDDTLCLYSLQYTVQKKNHVSLFYTVLKCMTHYEPGADIKYEKQVCISLLFINVDILNIHGQIL